MDARQELLEVYDFWLASSEREGEAIRAGDWPVVAQCQEVKRQLQPKIIRHTETAQQEWTRAGRDWADVQRDVRAVVGLLMDLATANSSRADAVGLKPRWRGWRGRTGRSSGCIAPTRRSSLRRGTVIRESITGTEGTLLGLRL